MRWWVRCCARELPPLTVEAPGVWQHGRGTPTCCLQGRLTLPQTCSESAPEALMVPLE